MAADKLTPIAWVFAGGCGGALILIAESIWLRERDRALLGLVLLAACGFILALTLP